MKEEMKKRINEAIRIKARELAAEEGRGYIEAEWLQTQDIGLDINVEKYIEDAAGKGYRSDDIVIKIYISTHDKWYTWLAYLVEHPLLGSTNSGRVKFPERHNHEKAFVVPLYEKEIKEAEKREKIELEESLKQARIKIIELREEIDKLNVTVLHEIVEAGEFSLDDVIYTINTND